MPTFVSLVNWTDQGIKTYRDTLRRAGCGRPARGSSGTVTDGSC